LFPFCAGVPAIGVGQPHIILASIARLVCRIRPVFLFLHLEPWRSKSGEISLAVPPDVGVGHPIEPLSDMRRARARSAQIGGPDLISHCLQVSTYSSEPVTSSRARNLLSKRDCRSALADEIEERWPEVSLVFFSKAFAGLAEWLARA